MAEEIQRFEHDLKAKVSNKSSSHQSEEGFLIKQFKFFDIYNTGVLSFDNFYRTIEKIGMVIDKEETRVIYSYLNSVNESGDIDYKSYAKYLYSKSFVEAYKPIPKGQTYSPSKSAVYEESEGGTPAYNILRSGMNSEDYPLATTAHFYRPSSSAGRKSLTNPYYVNEQMIESLEQNLKNPECETPQESETESAAYEEVRSTFNYGHEPEYYMKNQYSKTSVPKSQVLYVERFKNELQKRGGRGIIGLLRQFKIFDTDASGYLDKYEFKKAVDDYEVDVHPKDLDNLFNCFDKDKNGRIEYNEFLEAISGPLSKYRLQLVERVFDKLDKKGDGFIDMDYMLSCYDSSRHPDVASGKNDTEGAYCEFKDQFEVYHNICNNYDSSAQISRDEFTNFYTFVSAQYPGDAQFDILLNGVWNLDNKNNYDEMPYAGAPNKITKVDARSSWLNDHHRKMFGGSSSDPITFKNNDYTWYTTHSANYRTDLPLPEVTAGVPTWPVGTTLDWQGGLMHDDQRMHGYSKIMNPKYVEGYQYEYETNE